MTKKELAHKIFDELRGIDKEDLSKAEKKILALVTPEIVEAPAKSGMLITAEQKQNACDFLLEMQQVIQQPDTDDLHFIRTELSDHFAELLKQLE